MFRLQEFLTYLVPVATEQGASGRQGLQRLLLLRSFVAVVGVFGLLAFQSIFGLVVSYMLIASLSMAVLISVALGYWRLQKSFFVSDAELFCHLLIDAVILVILLLNTGGASNPLISYLLVLLAVTAALLPRTFVNSFALLGILIYTSLLLLDLQSDHGMDAGPRDQEMIFQLHLVGMWVIFLVSSILIAVFITQMANAIKVRELNLAEARENEIRNEQLVAIGTLAAGTAHALGTPLSTMAVLLTELDKLDAEDLKNSEIKEDISVLRQQITRCKQSLMQLTRYYNKDNPDQPKNVSSLEFVNDIKDYILNIHPRASIEFKINCNYESEVISNLSVRHAVINIIENSIKAAKNKVYVSFNISDNSPSKFEISINDDGPGIPSKIMENMGEPFISSRKESMGLGIFLANAAVQRLGGTIEMFNLKIGGALTLIKLPLPKSQQG